ncbi:MAG: RNA polymerase factor sigma-54 [Dissulfurimicrobium sp.]|uniref:RNA polymerase factor sigma-54 n=1 Tax=Dissulfurimicrobium TaxID=1769732 RepID=UPI001EDA6470|nr:RNA polymerase factor sigma-54 [Dissulfurimicrobium hydrothermale]UKL13512.1 RNA polymerase factor sigma-54 [Dissulfurimicrobium hydrothermale]
MVLELKQNLKLTQQLVMTPQLQQAIKLLQLSRAELIDTINEELRSNPVLEEDEAGDSYSSTDGQGSEGLVDTDGSIQWEESVLPSLASTELEKTPWEDKAIEDVDWKQFWDEDRKNVIQAYSFEEKESPDYENLLTCSANLAEYLMWQLQMSRMDDEERAIGGLIIGNLDENGYLKASVQELAGEIGCATQKVEAVLRQIQMFDPVGVAARDLKECLLIQIEHLGVSDPLVRDLIIKYFKDVERHNYQVIAKATGRSIDDVLNSVTIISHLEPYPGRSYNTEETHYIVPDIYVYKIEDEYIVTLNEEDIPRLKINAFYREALTKEVSSNDVKDFIHDKLKSAIWLIRSIEQRQKTIFKVTTSIVKFQREFLDKGIDYFKPLKLRDVAEDVQMHESTISRVTTNKYVQTPQGLFELKFFFSRGINRENGEDIATHSIKQKIKQLVQSEDSSRPYSDKKIVELLEKDNIHIARRTVAKYREMLGISPSSHRKRINTKS